MTDPDTEPPVHLDVYPVAYPNGTYHATATARRRTISVEAKTQFATPTAFEACTFAAQRALASLHELLAAERRPT